MSISTTTRKAGPFTGNGATASFPFTFKVFAAADLLVVRGEIATSAEVELTLGTHYSVTLNSNQDTTPGGSVNWIGTPLSSAFTLTIGSKVAMTQPASFTNLGRFYPRALNDALDRVTIVVQQLGEQVGRSLKVNFSSVGEATPDALLASLGAATAAATEAANSAAVSAASVAAAAGAVAGAVQRDGSVAMTAGLPLVGNATALLHAVPKQQMDAAIAAVVVYQPGQRVELFRATIPAGTRLLKANGAAVPVSSYADMAAAIYCGDANNAAADWGYRTNSQVSPSANRSTTGAFIVLPDARGRFGRGWADDGSLDTGRNLWRYQDHALQDHYHLSSGANNANGVGPGSGVMGGSGQTATTGAIGANVAGETRPVNAAALVCIAY